MSAIRFVCYLSILGVALVLGAASANAADDETYDLRGPAPKKGQAFRATNSFAMKNAKISLIIGAPAGTEQPDMKLEGKMEMLTRTDKEIEVLAVDGRNVVKIRSKVVKDNSERKITINNETKTEPDIKALQGEIVLSEFDKAKKKWKHVLEDAKPTEAQLKELKSFDDPDNDDELYPAEKVKVGHAWKIEPSGFKKILGSKFAVSTGKGSSKLLRVEKVNDELCAVIETEFDVKGKIKDDEDGDVDIEMKGKLISYRSVALCIDVKFSIHGEAKFAEKLDQDGAKVDVRFEGKMACEGKLEIKKRD